MRTEALWRKRLEQGEVRALAEHFSGGLPPVEELASLLHHRNEAIVCAVLSLLEERLPLCDDAETLRRWASGLPRQISTFSAELQRTLARLYRQLGPWLAETEPLPWRQTDKAPALRLAWLTTALHLAPEEAASEPDQELLWQALSTLQPQEIEQPERLLSALLPLENELLQEQVCRLLEECLQAGSLPAGQAQEMALALCRSSFSGVVERALRLLAQPWAGCFPCPAQELRQLLRHPSFAVASQALQTCAAWQQGEVLELALKDEQRSPRLRREAMKFFGWVVLVFCFDDLLYLAAQDPLFYGGACLNALEDFHRRGIFLQPTHLERLWEIFCPYRLKQPQRLAALTFPCRRALLAFLDTIDPDQPAWEHWLPVVVATESKEVPDLLLRLLSHTSNASLRRQLIAALAQVEVPPPLDRNRNSSRSSMTTTKKLASAPHRSCCAGLLSPKNTLASSPFTCKAPSTSPPPTNAPSPSCFPPSTPTNWPEKS
jgi:hypothetical protein